MNLFTYGSLMFQEVWQQVTGLTAPGLPARLPDHAARRIRGQSYPALVECPDVFTDGILYQNVPPDAVARLDAFEGSFYDRIMVAVLATDGTATSAWVYRAAKPEDPDILPEAWQADCFARDHLHHFLRNDPGFSPDGR